MESLDHKLLEVREKEYLALKALAAEIVVLNAALKQNAERRDRDISSRAYRTNETADDVVQPSTTISAADTTLKFRGPAVRVDLWVNTLPTRIEIALDENCNDWRNVTPGATGAYGIDLYCYAIRNAGATAGSFVVVAYGATAQRLR